MPPDTDSDGSSSSSSSISITSTAPSEERSDYEFEEIISETTVRGIKYYLVSWTNYRLDEATWEPLSHFDRPEEALAIWEETKRAIERGEKTPVDIYAVRRQAIDREIAAQKRRLKRRAKRKRLGLPVDSDSECELTPADFDCWEPAEPENAERGQELPSQPIWAAFRPIRFRRHPRRIRTKTRVNGTGSSATPLTLTESSSSTSSSSSDNDEGEGGSVRDRRRASRASNSAAVRKRQSKKAPSAPSAPGSAVTSGQ
ncbi:magnesium ion transporter, partial [Ascosphaera pollenicola]